MTEQNYSLAIGHIGLSVRVDLEHSRNTVISRGNLPGYVYIDGEMSLAGRS